MFICSLAAQSKITVIYPKEGSQVIASDSTFIFGNVSPPNAKLFINNKPITLYPNGAFLAMVPITPGRFSFICQAVTDQDQNPVRCCRNVYVPNYLKTSRSDTLIVDTSFVFPKQDWELQPGDLFKVAVKGTPDCNATFSIDGVAMDLPMTEIAAQKLSSFSEGAFGDVITSQLKNVRGIYVGTYLIRPVIRIQGRQIRFKLIANNGNAIETIAPGRLTIINITPPRIAEFNQEVTLAQMGKRSNYQYFFPVGTIVRITGRRGNQLRIPVSAKEQVWVRNDQVKFLPTQILPPKGSLIAIQTEDLLKQLRVRILLTKKVPVKIEQITNPSSLSITFYGVTSNNNTYLLKPDHHFIQGIEWKKITERICQMRILLTDEQQWGFRPFYEDSSFCIDIKKKPVIATPPFSPLKDLVICLDPGHGPDLGAVGPSGTIEKDINYRYCAALKQKLEEKGAYVVLTRGEKNGATIAARVQTAVFMDADILLSLHFNALPDGVDPFKNRGISTYYFLPQSYRLAHWIQKMLLNHTLLPNFGLYSDNLAMLRLTQMIAVLTEPGFIMHPWEEILINSESFQGKVITAIIDGLEQFLKETK